MQISVFWAKIEISIFQLQISEFLISITDISYNVEIQMFVFIIRDICIWNADICIK